MKIVVNNTGVFPTLGEVLPPRHKLGDLSVSDLLALLKRFPKDDPRRTKYKLLLFMKLYSGSVVASEMRYIVREWDEPVWISKDGRYTPVSAMETTHLVHAINKIIRKENWRKDWLPVLARQLVDRVGDSSLFMVITDIEQFKRALETEFNVVDTGLVKMLEHKSEG